MPTPTILLDLDGTLIDSQPGILSSCRAALRALGHVTDPSLDISSIIGPPIEEILRLLLEPYGDDRVAEAVSVYRAAYGENGLFDCALYPGIAQALTEMRQAGAQMLLATSKRRNFAELILDHLEITQFFDGIYGSEATGVLDYKPDLVAHIVERHTLTQSHCVMVGDRRYDVAGAHANKIRALGVLWGYGRREELEAAGADAFVAKPHELSRAALAIATGN